eukprot:288314-Pleurochrysis_carterae.AAC.1
MAMAMAPLKRPKGARPDRASKRAVVHADCSETSAVSLPGNRITCAKVLVGARAGRIVLSFVCLTLQSASIAHAAVGAGDSSGDPDTPRQGDWTCPVCEANVFATKLNCAPRPLPPRNFLRLDRCSSKVRRV